VITENIRVVMRGGGDGVGGHYSVGYFVMTILLIFVSVLRLWEVDKYDSFYFC